jgi:hypothetical protein
MPINIDAAKNKLLQAELLSAQLNALSAEIARNMRRTVSRDYRVPLETYFSACLNAARSCCFILARTGGAQFKRVKTDWRNNTLDQRGRTRFNAMTNLRDRDVHYGEMSASALPKMIPVPDGGDAYGHHYNAVLFGLRPMAEHTNPDGIMVRSPALQGTVGRYLEIGGCVTEATSACAEFISQLRSLVSAAEAAGAKKAAASAELPHPASQG